MGSEFSLEPKDASSACVSSLGASSACASSLEADATGSSATGSAAGATAGAVISAIGVTSSTDSESSAFLLLLPSLDFLSNKPENHDEPPVLFPPELFLLLEDLRDLASEPSFSAAAASSLGASSGLAASSGFSSGFSSATGSARAFASSFNLAISASSILTTRMYFPHCASGKLLRFLSLSTSNRNTVASPSASTFSLTMA
mmetsp:Transcript_20926/g.36003  ORF Transcript_20926/g.36003 Transcript_20926/m.36003 type:complete len:202 (-) Transcript_20926:216-821(-)